MRREQIRVGIVGTGRISDLHAIEYRQNPAARITAVCDISAELAQSRAAAWSSQGSASPQIAVETDLDRFLARSDIDLVEILLPHHLHLDAALKAIDAGKIVSLQKPMCLNLAEADQLVAAAKASAQPFKVFENFIFYPPVIKARELIDEGAIGTPLSIRIKSNPARSTTAWEVPAAAQAWRQQKDFAGGGPLVFDDGHHKFALAWQFMGEPAQVHAFIHQTELQDGSLLDAPSMISFSFPGNRVGNLEVVYSPDMELNTNHYAQDDRVEITGTEGIIWINSGHGHIPDTAPLSVYRQGKLTHYNDIASAWEQSFVLSTRHFLDVLQHGGEPLLTAAQARTVLRIALAAEQSAATARPVLLQQGDS